MKSCAASSATSISPKPVCGVASDRVKAGTKISWIFPRRRGRILSMTHAQAKARHAQLAAEIRQHDDAYYVEAKPIISDREYDKLYHELVELEQQFPDLVTPDSPTQRVGGQPLREFQPVQHLVPMMSLDNTYSQEEVRQFVARVQRLLPREQLEWEIGRAHV